LSRPNLLVVNGTPYLIDAGDGVTRRIVQAGYDFRKVGRIFITHLHDDHTAGLATLLTSQWEFQSPPTDIYGSGVEALVKGAIAYLTPNAEIRWAEGKKRPMTDVFHGHDAAPGLVYGIWDSKTPAEQEGDIRHLEQEHITPEVVGKMAAKAGVKAVVMTHLVATVDPNDDYQRYVDGATKYFSGPITLAKDLMQF
jgi:ribonuclease BN (tRNA processing enzyme)